MSLFQFTALLTVGDPRKVLVCFLLASQAFRLCFLPASQAVLLCFWAVLMCGPKFLCECSRKACRNIAHVIVYESLYVVEVTVKELLQCLDKLRQRIIWALTICSCKQQQQVWV